MTASQSPLPSRARARFLKLGIPALVLAALAGVWLYRRAALRAEQERKARDTFQPAIERLEEQAKAKVEYDLDRTVRAIHSIDFAVGSQRSLREHLTAIARQDMTGVHPDVLKARSRILGILMKLYARQTEAEQQQAFWDYSVEAMLTTLSLVDVELGASGIAVGVDPKNAELALAEFKTRQAAHQQLMREVGDLEQELFAALLESSETYYRILDEWDRLCLLRDRAYLAVHEGNWDAVLGATSEAIRMAPGEREAHLLRAVALLERTEVNEVDGLSAEADTLLRGYLEQHPGSSAPALLLLGVLQSRNGNVAEAKLSFQQAAAYYPKQAAELTSMLDPYRARAWLRKSREGNYIVEMYRSTMLGAGYFSPDLQLAKLHFEAGEFELGKAKVMDHFARRRTQEQWDFIVSDIRFCQGFLGAHFQRIFPEESYLDLAVKPSLIGSSLGLRVRNRSPATLHNATLVLCLHFTDMHPDDYETVTADATVPAVAPHGETDFGVLPVKLTLFGKEKGVGDVVSHRAILISNDAVTWVDTQDFKIHEVERLRAAESVPSADGEEWARITGLSVDGVGQRVREGATFSVREATFGKDSVEITLPSELAILKPVFRLRRHDGTELTPKQNEIVGSAIRLVFESVANFRRDPPGDLTLLLLSPRMTVGATWSSHSPGSFALSAVGPR